MDLDQIVTLCEPVVIKGVRVIFSNHMTMTCKRTISERLFSWPWRPWNRTKEVPDKYLTVVPGPLGQQNMIVCHPAMRKSLEEL